MPELFPLLPDAATFFDDVGIPHCTKRQQEEAKVCEEHCKYIPNEGHMAEVLLRWSNTPTGAIFILRDVQVNRVKIELLHHVLQHRSIRQGGGVSGNAAHLIASVLASAPHARVVVPRLVDARKISVVATHVPDIVIEEHVA